MTVLDKTFHRTCVFCAKCRKNIDAGDKVTIVGGDFCCQTCTVGAENERTGKDLSKRAEDFTAKREEKMSVEKEQLTSPDSGLEVDLRDGEDGAVLLSPNLLSPISDASGYKSDMSAAFDSSGVEKTGESSFIAANNISSDNSNFGTELRSPHDVPNGQLDFGKFYATSFLDKDTGFKRGPSINLREKSQHHFHRPGDFSYRKVRSDINMKPSKAGMMNSLGGRNQTSSFQRTGDPPYKPIKSQEPIQLAKIPDAQRFNCDHKMPIERDDFVAPPEAAAICPELLREVQFRRKSENGDCVDGDGNKENEATSDPKTEREISELSKMSSSGAAQMILEELKKKRSAEQRELDPRSSSRTASAAIEPPKKTRYDSSMFASPSRDLLRLRFWQFDNTDDCKYRRCFTPSVPRPGYGLRSQTLDHRSGVKSAMSFREDSFDRGLRHDRSLGIRSATLGPRNGYLSDANDGYNPSNFIHRRPEKAVVNSELITGPVSDTEVYDSTTGLKVTRSMFQRLNILVDGRLTPSSRSSLRRNVPAIFADQEGAKIFSYESLRLDSQDRPHGIDNNYLEQYLADEEFERLFRMPRAEFLSLAEWKRNDLKQRVALFESTSEKPLALNTSLEKPPTPITA